MKSDFNVRQVGLAASIVMATVFGLMLIWQLSGIVAVLVFSLALAAMARAPVDWLVGHRIPRGLALVLTYVLGLVAVVWIAWFVLPRVANELSTFAGDLGKAYAGLQSRWLDGGNIAQALARNLPSSSQLDDALAGSATGIAQLALGTTVTAFDVVMQGVLAIFITLYLSADQGRFERIVFGFIAPDHRSRARDTWHEIERGVGAYMRSEAAQSLLAWMMLSAAFWVLGVRYPFTLALFAAVAWLLPLMGGAIAIIPILVIGLLFNPLLAVISTLIACAVFVFLEFVVEKRLYPRERLGSVLMLMITIIMVEAFGVVGLLIAPPIATAIQIALNEWMRPAPAGAPATGSQSIQSSLGGLSDRLTIARSLLQHVNQPSPRMLNLFSRLTDLIARSNDEIRSIDERA